MTPEGKVKAKVNRLLAKYPDIYKFMPVQMGYGKQTLDYLLCVPTAGLYGAFVAVETKRAGKDLTPNQQVTANEIQRAHGVVFTVSDDESYERFAAWLEQVYDGEKA